MTSLKKIFLLLCASISLQSIAHANSFTNSQVPLSQANESSVQKVEIRNFLMSSNAVALKRDRGETSFDVWSRMRRNFAMNEVRSDLVQRNERVYSSSPEAFARMVDRARPFLYYIQNEVEKRGMPSEVVLLPFIESGFKPGAKSYVGATGLWQFMSYTGKEYGLNQTKFFDARDDFMKATQAALDYLQGAYKQFGDWALAFAAYNAGPGAVSRAIKRAEAQGKAPIFDNLQLPAETTNYVPRLIAVRNIIQNPEAFGIKLASVKNKPYFEAVSLNQPVDMAAIARLADMSLDDLMHLNAGHRVPVWIPRKDRYLLLPVAKTKTFINNLGHSDPNKLLSWQVYNPSQATSVSAIAEKVGMSVSEFKRINQFYGNTVPAGYTVLVSSNANMYNQPQPVYASNDGSYNQRAGLMNASYTVKEPVPSRMQRTVHKERESAQKRERSRYKFVTVRKGDNLHRIAFKAGMTISQLKSLNGLKSDQINAGQKIKVAMD